MPSFWIIVVVAAALAALIGLAVLYNALVGRRQMAQNGWADIDAQLKRRADLIPLLVQSVQAYASHERALFEEVAERRMQALGAGEDPGARGAAESALSQPVGRLVALSEAYPDLKANENFLALQKDLADTENKIEMARRFYNGAVRELNTLVQSFPSNLVAGALGFSQRAYFEIESGDRATPRVDMGAP